MLNKPPKAKTQLRNKLTSDVEAWIAQGNTIPLYPPEASKLTQHFGPKEQKTLAFKANESKGKT